MSIPLRMFRKIMFSPGYNGTPCWLWQGSRSPGGYGQVRVDRKLKSVHRVIYELLVSPIPEGLDLDHLCRNRACCNPNHLEPVTRSENLRRGLTGKFEPGKGVGDRQKAKTHCPQGHPYDEGNTHHYKSQRYCRTCSRERNRIARAQGRVNRTIQYNDMTEE